MHIIHLIQYQKKCSYRHQSNEKTVDWYISIRDSVKGHLVGARVVRYWTGEFLCVVWTGPSFCYGLDCHTNEHHIDFPHSYRCQKERKSPKQNVISTPATSAQSCAYVGAPLSWSQGRDGSTEHMTSPQITPIYGVVWGGRRSHWSWLWWQHSADRRTSVGSIVWPNLSIPPGKLVKMVKMYCSPIYCIPHPTSLMSPIETSAVRFRTEI